MRNKHLTRFARNLRKRMTSAERLFWSRVRGKAIGVKVRRQYPVLRFIADFYVPASRTIIEIDGGYHDAIKDKDAERDRLCIAAGYNVLRFTNEQVFADVDAVLAAIAAHLRRTLTP